MNKLCSLPFFRSDQPAMPYDSGPPAFYELKRAAFGLWINVPRFKNHFENKAKQRH